MKLSLAMGRLDAATHLALATEADGLGFDTYWLPDHLLDPAERRSAYPYTTNGSRRYADVAPLADVWVTAGAIGALTNQLRIGSGVYVAPLRNPFVTALAVATAERLAPGRILFGAGVGWLEDEFDAVGEQFAGRGRRFDEIIDIVTGLWTGAAQSHCGEFYSFDVVSLGSEVTGPVPLVLGGTSSRAIERCARRAAGWYGPEVPIEESIRVRDAITATAAASGRTDMGEFLWAVRVHGELTEASLFRYRDAGFEHVVVTRRSMVDTWGGLDLVRLAAMAHEVER